jgi:hypothetical protein
MSLTPENDPLALRIVKLLRLYKGEYDTPVPDYRFRRAIREEMFEILEKMGK